MYYSGYCTMSKDELDIDNLRVENNRDEFLKSILSSKKLCYAFLLGNVFVILFGSMPVWAEDFQPTQQAKKEFAKRASNAIGCGAITLACGKMAQSNPEVVQAAATEVSKSGNPKLIAAFACGAAVAWCAKYVIFDK